MPIIPVTKAVLFDVHSKARRPLSDARRLIILNQEGEALHAVRESLEHARRLETLLEERINGLGKPKPVPALQVKRRRDSARRVSQRRRVRATKPRALRLGLSSQGALVANGLSSEPNLEARRGMRECRASVAGAMIADNAFAR